MMCPLTHASFLALGVSVVASFIFGFLWYGPVFGKTWAGLMGFKMDESCKKPPVSALLLTLLGVFLTTVAMAYIIDILKPCCNFGMALLIWLGFYVPVMFSGIVWERKPWALFALNGAYYLLNLELIAAILTYLK